MSLNKKFISLTSILLQFIIFLLFLSANSPIQAQTNDIVVGIGNKSNVTIRILGPTTPTPTNTIIIDTECEMLRGGLCRSSCLTNENQIQAGCYPAGTICCKTLSSPTPTPISATLPVQPTITPVPPGFCIDNSSCTSSQFCNPATQRCTEVVCQTPPLCKRFTISNHSCSLQNETDGSFCTDSIGTGVCQNGNCFHVSISATGIPIPTRTKTPAPSPRPTSTSSPSQPTNIPSPGDDQGENEQGQESQQGQQGQEKDTITVEPEEDASVDEKKPDTNFGRRAISEVEGNHAKQHYMKFNIGKAVGKKIVSAQLNLRVANFYRATQNVRFVDDSNWSQDTITYNNRPATGDIIGTMSSTGQFGRFISVNLDPAGISTVDKNLTLEIDTPGKWAFHLFSKESFFKPKLILEYVK